MTMSMAAEVNDNVMSRTTLTAALYSVEHTHRMKLRAVSTQQENFTTSITAAHCLQKLRVRFG